MTAWVDECNDSINNVGSQLLLTVNADSLRGLTPKAYVMFLG